jgi:nucleoside-diphosphate-sugar epimerase
LEHFRRWTLIPFDFARSAIQERAIALKTSGEQSRNFVSTGDIAHTVAAWLSANVTPFSVFNPIGAETINVWRFAQICAEEAEALTGKPVSLTRVEPSDDSGPQFQYSTTTSFCRGVTGVRATTRELMRRLIHAQKDVGAQ